MRLRPQIYGRKIILRMMTSHRRYRQAAFERQCARQAVYGTQTRAANPLYASK